MRSLRVGAVEQDGSDHEVYTYGVFIAAALFSCVAGGTQMFEQEMWPVGGRVLLDLAIQCYKQECFLLLELSLFPFWTSLSSFGSYSQVIVKKQMLITTKCTHPSSLLSIGLFCPASPDFPSNGLICVSFKRGRMVLVRLQGSFRVLA